VEEGREEVGGGDVMLKVEVKLSVPGVSDRFEWPDWLVFTRLLAYTTSLGGWGFVYLGRGYFGLLFFYLCSKIHLKVQLLVLPVFQDCTQYGFTA
jgi:hypothetical protein